MTRSFLRVLLALAAAVLMPPAGAVTIDEFGVKNLGNGISDMVLGPDGNVWAVLNQSSSIASITSSGVITRYRIPDKDGIAAQPIGIAVGSDANLWFTDFYFSRIGRITPAGVMTLFDLALPTQTLRGGYFITADFNGNLYYTETTVNKIVKVTTAGALVGEFSVGAGPAGISAGWYSVITPAVVIFPIAALLTPTD